MIAPANAVAAQDMEALRQSVGISRLDHVVVLRIRGAGAFSLLDRLSTTPLYMREDEMRSSLMLTEGGHPFADVILASDEDGYLMLSDGPSEAALLEHIERHGRPAAAGQDVMIQSLAQSHVLWGLNGPYAWELASQVLGPGALGMTYMTMMRPPTSNLVAFRGGKTGEYGYDVLVPLADSEAWAADVRRRGEAFDLRSLGVAALDQAALENWQFNIRWLGASALAQSVTPIELQLQWRVGYGRNFVGADALRVHRTNGPAFRLTCFTASDMVDAGASVVWRGQPVGEVLASGWSHTRGEPVGVALLETRLAYPWLDEFSVAMPDGPVSLHTRTAPFLENRSLYVDPHRHAYATRAADVFPAVVPG